MLNICTPRYQLWIWSLLLCRIINHVLKHSLKFAGLFASLVPRLSFTFHRTAAKKNYVKIIHLNFPYLSCPLSSTKICGNWYEGLNWSDQDGVLLWIGLQMSSLQDYVLEYSNILAQIEMHYEDTWWPTCVLINQIALEWLHWLLPHDVQSVLIARLQVHHLGSLSFMHIGISAKLWLAILQSVG